MKVVQIQEFNLFMWDVLYTSQKRREVFWLSSDKIFISNKWTSITRYKETAENAFGKHVYSRLPCATAVGTCSSCTKLIILAFPLVTKYQFISGSSRNMGSTFRNTRTNIFLGKNNALSSWESLGKIFENCL